jgi:hypothetical protein
MSREHGKIEAEIELHCHKPWDAWGPPKAERSGDDSPFRPSKKAWP